MSTPAHLPPLAIVGIGLFVVWRIYSRVRRLVGRQHFQPVRAWMSLVLLPLLAGALLLGLAVHPLRAGVLVAGLAVGVLLAQLGLQRTRFEVTPQGLFYTPHAHIGIALSLLLTARIVYRLAQLYWLPDQLAEPPQHFIRSPLTLMILGTLLAYYARYAWGLIRWSRSVAQTPSP
ncbi:hypothetical protein [Ideonella dechloratans]|uniref:hypothetical protein n=1 Tax=Ideonella dechloratans TaxID=36863 RepID=UPI0035B2B841